MLIFRLDIFHPKILLYYSWGKENALKTKQNMQNIFFIRISIYIIKSLYVSILRMSTSYYVSIASIAVEVLIRYNC